MKNVLKFYQDKFVNLNGIRVRYWETGRGKDTLLLLHGLGGGVEEWSFNIPAFEGRFRVLAFDLPGHGWTDKINVPLNMDAYQNIVDAFLDRMRVKQAVIIGHSLGGLVALRYAVKNPSRTAKLILISPSIAKQYPLPMRVVTLPVIGELLFRPPSSLEQTFASFRDLTYEPFPMPNEIIERARAIYQSPGYVGATLKYLRNYLNLFGLNANGKRLMSGLDETAGEICQPALVFWGKEDKIVPFENIRILKNKIRNLKTYEIEKCGHNPHWEIAGEFNRKVLSFLK